MRLSNLRGWSQWSTYHRWLAKGRLISLEGGNTIYLLVKMMSMRVRHVPHSFLLHFAFLYQRQLQISRKRSKEYSGGFKRERNVRKSELKVVKTALSMPMSTDFQPFIL